MAHHTSETSKLGSEIFLAIDGQKFGPLGLEKAKALLKSRPSTSNAVVWCQGFHDWIPVTVFKELVPVSQAPSELIQEGSQWKVRSGIGLSSRSTKICASLTALSFIGALAFVAFRSDPFGWRATENERLNLEKIVEENICGPLWGADHCSVVSADVFSRGSTDSLPSGIFKIRYLVKKSYGEIKPACDFVHYADDSKWNLMRKIVYTNHSFDGGEECSATSEFQDSLKTIGYSGRAPEMSAAEVAKHSEDLAKEKKAEEEANAKRAEAETNAKKAEEQARVERAEADASAKKAEEEAKLASTEALAQARKTAEVSTPAKNKKRSGKGARQTTASSRWTAGAGLNLKSQVSNCQVLDGDHWVDGPCP